MKLEVQFGYLVDGEFTTRVNYNWQSPDSELPKGVVATKEEVEAYKNEETDREVYRTADGKFFLDFTAAKEHNKTVKIKELDEVMEQIEKLKILCEAGKSKAPVLATIQDALGQLSKDGGETMMDKYYDSTCW